MRRTLLAAALVIGAHRRPGTGAARPSSTCTSTTATTPGRAAAAEAIKVLRQAGVRRRSCRAPATTARRCCYKAAPDLIVPVLRPYRRRGEIGSWMRDPRSSPHVEARLKANTYAGIGEFHVFGADADPPVMRRMVQLAHERKIFLHAHSDADAVERIFKQNPAARVLWAHSGFDQPDNVRAMLTKHKTLWADLAFRSDHAPSGKLDPAWSSCSSTSPTASWWAPTPLARALALRGRARRLLAQVARRAAGRSRRQHRLPQRRAARRGRWAQRCRAWARRMPATAAGALIGVARRSSRSRSALARRSGGARPKGSAARLAEAEIAYRWEPAELKVGRFFAAEVIACRAPDAEPVRAIVLDAHMPAHGHGMNYRPAADADGPGPLPLHRADAAHARHLAADVRPVPGRQAHAPHARTSP